MSDGGALLVTTAVSLAAGGIAGWVSAAFRRREARRERVRAEVLRWANPILNSVEGLVSRLDNILEDNLHRALSPASAEADRPVDRDWAVSYEYVMPSTLFLFAEYFAWVQLMRDQLSLELFESERSHRQFLDATWKVTGALGDWPLKGDSASRGSALDGDDTQVFALQQRAIGELVIERDRDESRVVTYGAFLDALEAEPRSSLLQPLRTLLEGIEPGTKRWYRLECTRIALRALAAECRSLLRLDSASA